MDETLAQAIKKQVGNEPLARLLGMELIELGKGYSKVSMVFEPERMANIFKMAHGGAVFALIDEAFETASNSHGTVAVALSMNVTYLATPRPGARLFAEAREANLTRKTGLYDIRLTDEDGGLLATCQALSYRKKDPLPFL